MAEVSFGGDEREGGCGYCGQHRGMDIPVRGACWRLIMGRAGIPAGSAKVVMGQR